MGLWPTHPRQRRGRRLRNPRRRDAGGHGRAWARNHGPFGKKELLTERPVVSLSGIGATPDLATKHAMRKARGDFGAELREFNGE
jgi:hypothetical protein